MDKKEIVLAGLSPANGGLHSPVQVQKLFFLIDRNLGKAVNGPHFDFRPYNYGPYDKSVYEVLEDLEKNGLVEVIQLNWKEYRLTDAGQEAGDKLLCSLEPKTKQYIQHASEFVRKLTFTQLVSAIYEAYPEMRVNSVFQE
jgi:uncharacterized protein YwgA